MFEKYGVELRRSPTFLLQADFHRATQMADFRRAHGGRAVFGVMLTASGPF